MGRNRIRGLTLLVLIMVLVGGGLLSACGKKGPLYLPDSKPDVEKRKVKKPDTPEQ